MLPTVLALTSLGTTLTRVYVVGSDGKLKLQASIRYQNGDAPDELDAIICPVEGGNCTPDLGCVVCHASMDASKVIYTVQRHRQLYYPRFALNVMSSQKIPFGRSGSYVTSQSGQLMYYLKDGTVHMIAPPGSFLLNGRDGRFAMFYIPGDLRLLN
jgi:hypothetical protein